MACREHEIAFNLRNKIIAKKDALSKLNIPSISFSKENLRGGLQARTQRRENVRFIKQVERQKSIYDQKLGDINRYLTELDNRPKPSGEIGPMNSSPIPKVGFFGLPRLGRIRNIKKRGRR